MNVLAYDLPQSIELHLKRNGCTFYDTTGIDDFKEAAHFAVAPRRPGETAAVEIDAVLLGVDGEANEFTIREVRHAKFGGPFIIFTRQSTQQQYEMYNQGADVVILSGTDPELVRRQIQALVAHLSKVKVSVMRIGELVLDLGKRVLYQSNGTIVHLTGKEYEMLECFAMRRGTTVGKESLLNQMYGGMDEPEMKIIDVFVCKLRKKLAAANGGAQYLATEWGRGYRLIGENETPMLQMDEAMAAE